MKHFCINFFYSIESMWQRIWHIVYLYLKLRFKFIYATLMCLPHTGIRDHGRNWAVIANMVGTKTESQCRNFYLSNKRKMGISGAIQEYKKKRVKSFFSCWHVDVCQPFLLKPAFVILKLYMPIGQWTDNFRHCNTCYSDH